MHLFSNEFSHLSHMKRAVWAFCCMHNTHQPYLRPVQWRFSMPKKLNIDSKGSFEGMLWVTFGPTQT